MPSGAANRSVFDSQTGIDRARLHELDDRDEHQEQQDQSDDGVALKPDQQAAGLEARAPRRGVRRTAHLRSLTMA